MTNILEKDLKKIVIAIDVMGGDFGPEATIEGSCNGIKNTP